MAVIDDARGRGVGKALLAFLEDEARRRGATRLTLSAQMRAVPFYEKASYTASSGVQGAPHHDGSGILHVSMEKSA